MDKSVIPYIKSTIKNFEDDEHLGLNTWVEDIDDKNAFLTDYHDDEAQVVVLNTNTLSKTFTGAKINHIEFNFNSLYGIGTKLWIQVQKELVYFRDIQ